MESMFYTFPPYVHNMNIDDSNGCLKKLPAKWSEIPQLDPHSARVSTFGLYLQGYSVAFYKVL